MSSHSTERDLNVLKTSTAKPSWQSSIIDSEPAFKATSHVRFGARATQAMTMDKPKVKTSALQTNAKVGIVLFPM